MATETRPVGGVPLKERNVAEQKGAPVLTSSARSRPVSPAAVEADTVQVWPHLVVIEFLAAMIFTIMLVLLGTLVNSPLEGLADADKTPNPSKAPWYFLNLQELLLHMNSALAGVIVPPVALIALAAIPYIDRGSTGLGVWFYNKRGPLVGAFSAVYTTVILCVLIFLDQPTKVVAFKDTFSSWLKGKPDVATEGPLHWLTQLLASWPFGDEPTARGVLVEAIMGWTFPTVVMLTFIVLLVVILKRMFRNPPLNTSEIVIGLFSGFVATYILLTFVGTFMRGPGMQLFPPWDVPPTDYGQIILHMLGLV